MKPILFTVLFALPFFGFAQNAIDEMMSKKENLKSQINKLNDSIKAIDAEIQDIESEMIRAKVKLNNFSPIKAKNIITYSSLYKDIDMKSSFGYVSMFDYVKIIGINSENPNFAQVEYENKVGFMLWADLEIGASERKTIEAISKPIFEAQIEEQKQTLEKERVIKEAEVKKQIELVDNLRNAGEEIIKERSLQEKRESEENRIARIKKATKDKANQVTNLKEDEIRKNEAKTKRRDELIKNYGDRIGNLVYRHEVCIGMSDQIVRLSIGNPEKINKTVRVSAVSEQWIYRDRLNWLDGEYIFIPYSYLYFENGVLTTIQEQN